MMLCITQTRLLQDVRPSVTHWYCVKMAKHQHFSLSGSHAILVFPYQTVWQYSDGDLLNMGVECMGGMKT